MNASYDSQPWVLAVTCPKNKQTNKKKGRLDSCSVWGWTMPHCQNTSQVQQRRVCVISSRVVIHLTGEMCFTGILEGISLDYLKIGQEWQKRNWYNFIKSFVKKKKINFHTTYLGSYFKMDARVNLGGYTEYQAENKEGCERSHHFWLALSSSWALRCFSSVEKVSLLKHWQFFFLNCDCLAQRDNLDPSKL